ncbi:polysaccharide pyruvyl transferase family protein [Pseudactinotalea sp. Z1748]|uniref:polysaccharide pyruvyl transferase family protein n=1 Tax=Pseudactinotalea sp. Z1748 TaxID=3413027 RepID=UPI003C7E6865
MTRPQPRPRVGVAGLFGTGNFGNEATLTAALERLGDEHDVVVIAEGAARVHSDRGVPAVALSTVVTPRAGSKWVRLAVLARNRIGVLLRAMKVVGGLDAVVVAGTGPWERYGAGPFALTYELWALALAAKVRRRPFLLWNIGVEVQDRMMARWFIRRSASWADYRSFRDVESLRAMRQMRAALDSDPVVADLVFGFAADGAPSGSGDGGQEATVIVGVMTYYGLADDPRTNEDVQGSYRRGTTELVRELRRRDYGVVLVGGDEDDLRTAADVRDTLADEAVRVDTVGTVAGLTELMTSASAVVALRYHSLIMGALAGVPLVGIAYGQKQQSLMTMLGNPERVRHVESFQVNDVADLVEAAIVDAAGRERAAAAVADAAARLEEEWIHVRTALRRSRG